MDSKINKFVSRRLKIKNFLKELKLNESTISMALGILVIVVVGTLIFNYFRGVSKPGKESIPTPTDETKVGEGKFFPEELPTVYMVIKGDNLWQIAEKFYNSGYNWVDIAKENKLANPNLLFVDQELNIPKVEVRQPIKSTGSLDNNAVSISGDTYTVVRSDNLWEIAVRAYGDGYQWVKIASENNLANPDLIHSGNVLKLPR